VAKTKSPIKELVFPIGGLNRAAPYQALPPFTTPYAINVRPYDVVAGTATNPPSGVPAYRGRGGSRPGLIRFYDGNGVMGGATAVQLLGYAGIVGSNTISTNTLIVVCGGNLYYSVQTSAGPPPVYKMVQATGTFNSTDANMQGTQVGPNYYIADYRPASYAGQNGAVNSGGLTLTDSNLDGYVPASGDVVWISPTDPTQENIFPVASFNSGTNTLTYTNSVGNPVTPQTSGVVWQVGRMPQYFDPVALTVNPLFPSPIPPQNYATGTVSSAAGIVTLTGGTFPTLTTAQLAAGAVLTIPNVNGIGTQDYLVASQQSGTQLTLTDQTTDANCTNVIYTLTWTGDYYGVPPLGCPLCCTYRGRLVFAGPGIVWYMSRVLDPTDFDYGYDPNDPSRAVGGTSTTTGGIPEPIVALMPHSDAYLIFGCERSLWLLTGDPAYGGTITALSRDIGVLGPNAWCNLPDSSIVFLSRDGIYQIPSGASSPPIPISRPLLPAELLDVDWEANVVSMCYDVEARGIHISVSPSAGGVGTHYFLDWTLQRFWPVVFGSAECQPVAMVRYAANSSIPAAVIYGCYDGFLRQYSNTATADQLTTANDSPFQSLVTYGPFRFGGAGYDSQLLQIAADMDANMTGSVTWAVYAAKTAQQALAAAVANSEAANTYSWTGTWNAGYNPVRRPMCRGAAMVIVVYATNTIWAVEGMRIEAAMKGPLR
jgi:hypothetical protein